MNERTSRLAEWMGKKKFVQMKGTPYEKEYYLNEKKNGRAHWDPLTSWDDWRMVELKIMEDEELEFEFLSEIDVGLEDHSHICAKFLKADLPTKVSALLKVLDELV